MLRISGKPTLFASPRSTVLVAACFLFVALGILPPTLGRTASVSFANRLTLMIGFGCIETVWTSWPDAAPTWRAATAKTDRTRAGQFEWVPMYRRSALSSGPVHHSLAIPFWIILLPLAALSTFLIRFDPRAYPRQSPAHPVPQG